MAVAGTPLTASTRLALEETLQKLREEIMAGRSPEVSEYASAARDLAMALDYLDEDN